MVQHAGEAVWEMCLLDSMDMEVVLLKLYGWLVRDDT